MADGASEAPGGKVAEAATQSGEEEATGAANGRPRKGLLGLGSNVGDRRANLQAAVNALADAGVPVLASSSTYDTDPVGEILEQPSFLNACLLIETDLAPLALLDTVKRIERELGRAGGERRHAPRMIDIDVLLLGDLRLRHERMTLPHEQVLARRFVLIPALELDAELATPEGEQLADALASMAPTEGVRWAGAPLAVRGRIGHCGRPTDNPERRPVH